MTAFLLAAGIVALVAAITDWRTGHIPNVVTLAPLAAAPRAHFEHGAIEAGLVPGLYEMGRSLLGAFVCGLVPFAMFVLGGMGGGDVKLFAAIGALVLPLTGLEAETYAFISALFVAPARLAYDGVLLRTLGNVAVMVTNPFRPQKTRRQVPEELKAWFRLGPCIFIGVCAVLVTHLWGR
jgi:prepilin peptidase CpaA